jgi:hypothetical protein
MNFFLSVNPTNSANLLGKFWKKINMKFLKKRKRKLWQGQRKTRCKLKERKSKFQVHFMTNCGWAGCGRIYKQSAKSTHPRTCYGIESSRYG